MTAFGFAKPSPLGIPLEKTLPLSVTKPFMERYLIWPKLLFFLLTIVVYIQNPLRTKFFIDQLKLSYIEVSFVSAVGGINFFGALLWTWLADRSNKHKIILTICTVSYVGFISLNLYEPFDHQSQKTLALAYVMLVNTVANLFLSALFPLMDSLMMTMLTQDPTLTKEIFGRQRMFSAIGHGCSFFLSQGLVHLTLTLWGEKWYAILNIALVIFSILFIIAVWLGLPSTADVGGRIKHGHHKQDEGEKSGEKPFDERSEEKSTSNGSNRNVHTFLHSSVAQSLPTAPTPAPPAAEISLTTTSKRYGSPALRLLTDINFIFFMLFILTVGLLRNVLTVWRAVLTLGIKDNLLQNSYPVLLRTVAEIIVLVFGKEWIKVFGVYWMLIFSQITGLAQVIGYAFIPLEEKWYFATYPLELLKGLTSGLLTSAAVRIASEMAPKGCENTAQGLYSGNYSGISVAVGGLMTALLFFIQPNNGQNPVQFIFFWTAITSLVFTVLLAAKFIFYDRVMGVPGLPRKCSAPGKPL